MQPMTEPIRPNEPPSQPGERPPAGRLPHPPSERYGPRPEGAGGTGVPAGRVPSALRTLAPAIAASVVSATLITIVGGVLAEHSGLLAIAGIGGAVTGLLAARAGVSPDGRRPAPMARPRATAIAVGLALGTIVASSIAIWVYGRLEGGVMDPVSYLWATFGPFVPAEAVVAALAAAWGAGAGPVRGRS
jgi:hypothetical protein